MDEFNDKAAELLGLKQDNLAIWERVCETDPEHTRHVDRRGGFTAIDAQYQRKNATREFGPYGLGWGVKSCRYGYLCDGAGNPIEAWFEGIFWYPMDGEFEISSDAKFRPGNDTRKKLLTDATTKALSFLGFNSDVFEGAFDDNKYTDAPPPRQSSQQSRPPQQAQAPHTSRTLPPGEDGFYDTPPGQQRALGAGGPNTHCPECNRLGQQQKYWKPGSNNPDLDCPHGCIETWNNRQRALRWWSHPKAGG